MILQERGPKRTGPGGGAPAAPAGRKQLGGRELHEGGLSDAEEGLRGDARARGRPIRCVVGPLGSANGETLLSRSRAGGSTVLRRFRKDHTPLGRYVQLRGLRTATREGGRPDALAARRRAARPDCGKGRRRGDGRSRCARYAGQDQARRLLGATQRRRDETFSLVASPQNEPAWGAEQDLECEANVWGRRRRGVGTAAPLERIRLGGFGWVGAGSYTGKSAPHALGLPLREGLGDAKNRHESLRCSLPRGEVKPGTFQK